ncbi:zona pellucida sperm-binding protein 3-like [Oncorhynchus mykiss]|uniref:zona pellucida sperm-binding protein 3-like n=1 Tax=Oncorhynchus mykiss TaxID=8022 RepID=UPI001878354C|nr:zona pellucida sperm-binding protein 3-like [Oncorhynchus mykiss]
MTCDLELNRTKRPAGLQHQLPEMNTEYLQRYQTVEPTVWKYSSDSAPLQPTWIPFSATVSDNLQFSLKLMTSDWLYERGSGVYFLGDPINIEVSVRVAHHSRLRVFVSSCVATLDPDNNSFPRYIFIEHDGCLVDSQLPGSNSGFMHRTQDDKLQFHIDAFRFYQENRAELYIICHLMAIPVMDHAEPSNKACSFINGRWRSADSNYLECGRCPSLNSQKGVDHDSARYPLSPRQGGSQPRGYRIKPQATGDHWRSGMKSKKVWNQDVTLGPIMVTTKQRTPLSPTMEGIAIYGFPSPTEDRRPVSPGSRWKSGMGMLWWPHFVSLQVAHSLLMTLQPSDLGTTTAPGEVNNAEKGHSNSEGTTTVPQH